MSDEDTLKIVLNYKKMVMSTAGRIIVMKDKTVLPFLAYCLSSDKATNQLVDAAIETLYLLMTDDCNTAQLRDTFGVVEALSYICNRVDLPDCIKTKALKMFEKLCCKDAPPLSAHNQSDARELRRSLKSISLYVTGLSEENRHKLESTIIEVNGVISVVLDVNHQRCTLRTREILTPHILADAIYDGTGMEAKLITKNSFGQEIFKPLLETSSSGDNEENMPPYLSEIDSPIKKKAVSNVFLIKEKSFSWLDSALGFFQESFYW